MAQEQSRVSVVIATCGRDKPAFTRAAVLSVLQQTYRALEVLVVADGPLPDETQHFLDEYVACDSRLRVLALPAGQGPANARNEAIAVARGAYVAILDADDVAAPERVERQVAFLQETRADLVGCCYRLIDASGHIIGHKDVPQTPQAIRRALCWFNPIANSTVCARAEILKRHPYREPLLKGPACFGEDYDLWVTLALEGCALHNMRDELVDFRTDPAFLNRRRGWGVFRTDLRIKVRAARLYPTATRAVALLAAILTASVRMLPLSILHLAYAIRNGLQFGSRKGD